MELLILRTNRHELVLIRVIIRGYYMFKKIILLAIFALGFCFASPTVAVTCQPVNESGCAKGEKCVWNEKISDYECSGGAVKLDYGLNKTAGAAGYTPAQKDWTAIVSRVISVFLSLVAVVFFAMSLYAGLRWLTARGNDELSGKAKNALIAAVSGLVVVVLSWAVTNFIVSKLQPVNTVIGDYGASECCCANIAARNAPQKEFVCMTSVDKAHCAAAGGAGDVREAVWTTNAACSTKTTGGAKNISPSDFSCEGQGCITF